MQESTCQKQEERTSMMWKLRSTCGNSCHILLILQVALLSFLVQHQGKKKKTENPFNSKKALKGKPKHNDLMRIQNTWIEQHSVIWKMEFLLTFNNFFFFMKELSANTKIMLPNVFWQSIEALSEQPCIILCLCVQWAWLKKFLGKMSCNWEKQ